MNHLFVNTSRAVFGLRSVSIVQSPYSTKASMFPAKITPMLPPGTFDGRVAFITGGGTGFGAGMAAMLSQLGAHVIIASRRKEVIAKTAEEITKTTNNKVFGVQCDVKDPSSVEDAVSKGVSEFGQLPSIIINNAAGNFISPTEKLSANAWKSIIDIVLNGTINVTMDIGKRLIDAKQRGTFLNISTTYVRSGSAFVVPSACAKAGVEAMTKSLASEWSYYGLRFNCLAPGPIYTEGAFSRLDPTGNMSNLMESRIPAGRFGEIAELSNIASYLVSDYSSWMTGSVVTFDGGEFNFMAGEFNELMKMPKENWDAIRDSIKRRTKS